MKRLAISLLLLLSSLAYAEQTIHKFKGAPRDGAIPLAGLVADSAGNLYGTTIFGGPGPCQIGSNPPGCGTIFELSPDGSGDWKETVLYKFHGGKDGQHPGVTLAIDSLGNLYGTIAGGGTCPPTCGNVFELSPDGTLTVLYRFKGKSDGGVPPTGLAMDSSGALYGTTSDLAGTHGTVFQLSNSGNKWRIKTLHTFAGGEDGDDPQSTPLLDKDGSWYGTTEIGGKNNFGVLYKLTFDTKWHYNVVYSFPAKYEGPRGNLAQDANGILYGVTIGDYVFQLTEADGKWSGETIHKFSPNSRQGDGTQAEGGVALDASGNVYGVTAGGTPRTGYGGGTVYQLVPGNSKWTENILHAFGTQSGGDAPIGQIIFGPDGNLYGVTQAAGNKTCHCGTVFGLAP
jgi:uncharacterized repeat protein (TIGR03803 family)